jgi:hypothetical protein
MLVFIELEYFLNLRYGSDQTLQSYTRKFSEYMDAIKEHAKAVVADLNGIIQSEDQAIEAKVSECSTGSLLRRRAWPRGIRKSFL